MKKRGFRIFFSLLILSGIFSVGFYLVFYSSFFHIKDVAVSGNQRVSKEEVIALSGIKKGTGMFNYNRQIVSKSIEIHPMIKQAIITRHYPEKIDILIVEREIWAIIPYQEIFLCVDDEGVCIDRMQMMKITEHIIITLDQFPEHINLGQVVHPLAVGFSKEIWNLASPSSREKISQFHYSQEGELFIYTRLGTEIRLGNNERIEEKVQVLEKIFMIEKDMIAGGIDVLEYVDLRFKGQPVVKTKNRG